MESGLIMRVVARTFRVEGVGPFTKNRCKWVVEGISGLATHRHSYTIGAMAAVRGC